MRVHVTGVARTANRKVTCITMEYNGVNLDWKPRGNEVVVVARWCESHVLDDMSKLRVPEEAFLKMRQIAYAVFFKKKPEVKNQLVFDFGLCVHHRQEFIGEDLSTEYCELGGTKCDPCDATVRMKCSYLSEAGKCEATDEDGNQTCLNRDGMVCDV